MRLARTAQRRRGRKQRWQGVAEPLEARELLAADLIISEFMANNGQVLADEDGDHSDWIEIYNRGTQDVSLAGWHLTDDATDLNKWSFPDQPLAAGNFLVVFASNKDRAQAGQVLHTNFSLDAAGEYLALTHDAPLPNDANHREIVSEYTPQFPQQIKHVSFGVGQSVTIDTVMNSSSPARLFYPTNGNLGTSWTLPGFSDSSWTVGTAAIGYESSVPGFTVLDAKSTGQIVNLSGADALLNGTGQASAKTAIKSVVNFWDAEGGGGTGNFGNPTAFPNNQSGDDNDFAIRATGTISIPSAGTWTFGTNSDDGVRVRVDGQNVINDDTQHGPDNRFGQANLSAGPHELELVFFERGGGAEVELFAAKGSFTTFNTTAFKLIGDVAGGGLSVHTSPNGGGSVGGLSDYFKTDVTAAMKGITPSVYLRVPFGVADPAKLKSLSLRMRYDDGFVAYLNGVEIARRNAPASVQFNSTATTDRDEVLAVQVENIDISNHLDVLTSGVNVLAIQGLNEAASSGEFLLQAELAQINVANNAAVYFTSPTPGAFNGATGVAGFLLDEIQFSQPHGFYNAPISVAISAATAGTTIRYTTDGTLPTTTNGTVYTGPLTIDKTTTLRARSFKDGLSPSYVETASYMFISDIVRQSPTGTPPTGWPTQTNINGQVLDYGMDPDIVNSATWGPQLEAALKQVPTMSVVMNVNDLLNPSTGIYTNTYNHGPQWERPMSLELINPDGSTGFQINGGVRIRGGYSRSTGNPKHALRFFFRDEYGDAKLKFPLFGSEGTNEFDSFDLRTTQNYSWSFEGNPNNSFVRDIFSRDLQGKMGDPYTRGRYYHLYINGQYWGLYQTDERPEASYAASYFGGSPEDYDVIKSAGSNGGYQNEATDGNMDAYQRLANYFYQAGGLGDAKMADYWKAQGMNPDGTRNASFERLLDVDNLIDYMVITYYTGDRDGPATRFVTGLVNNYFAIINRNAPDGFKFFEHDSEHSLDTGDANMVTPLSQGGNQIAYFNPHWMHEQLATNNREYRQRFADRVYKYLFNNGLLTASNATALLDARASQIDLAIIAESARWGDAKSGTPLTKNDWLGAISRIRSFLQSRAATVVQQLQVQGWYPSTAAPNFSVNGTPSLGGAIDSNDAVRMFTQSTTSYESIVPAGASWKYLANGSNQGTSWTAANFDDAAWPSGNAEFGYGDGGEVTTIPCGPAAPNCGSDKYVTTYFRKSFNVADPSVYQVARIGLRRDDGAAVYLNGVEIVRSNLANDAKYDQFADVSVGGADESTYFQFEFPKNLLLPGRNVLAVEVHQQSMASSDISFDLQLEGGRLNGTNGQPIYYTTDGTDPRAIGGQPSASAVQYDGNPLPLTGSRLVKARTLINNQWSPLAQASFLLDVPASADNLRVSEINYNPHAPLTQLGEANVDNNQFEFVELQNISSLTIDLTNVKFTRVNVDGNDEGIDFEFATQTLAPGQRVVVARNRAAFQSRYGANVRLAESFNAPLGTGVFTDSLSNSGERLTLVDATGAIIQQFDYDDSGAWPGRADGGGSSLEVDDPSGDYTRPGNFRNSNEFGGSPGTAGTGALKTVVINELLTKTTAPQPDMIELFNTTGQPVNVANWYLSDNNSNYFKFKISPAQAAIPAGGYLVFNETQLGFGFRGEASDDAWLIAADAQGRPIRFVDHVEFGAAQNALGRWPNGSGDLFPMTSATLGSANAGPALANVVISEVGYRPVAGFPTPEAGEFVEIWNRGGTPLNVGSWRLNRGLTFTFPTNTVLNPGARVAVVPFDPVADAAAANRFRQLYGISAAEPLLGPFTGRLDDAGEVIELERPENVAQLGVGYVLVDRVDYQSVAPWPTTLSGQSLNRMDPVAYGDFAASWVVAASSPGKAITTTALPGDFDKDQALTTADVNLLCGQVRAAQPSLEFDLTGNGQVDFDDMRYMINSLLHTTFGDANLDGQFDPTDLIQVFVLGQYEDDVTNNSTWETGDWDCDGDFGSGDLVIAFQEGGYLAGASPAALARDAVAAMSNASTDRFELADVAASIAGRSKSSTDGEAHDEHLAVDRIFALDDAA